MKLEKVEIGGLKGRGLSGKITKVRESFLFTTKEPIIELMIFRLLKISMNILVSSLAKHMTH
jgi:hypothetical protein